MAATADIRAGRAFIELSVDNSAMVRGLKAAQRQLRGFSKSVTATGKRMLAVSAAMALPFVLSGKVFAGFDDEMRTVKAVTGATAQEFDLLTEKAKLLGRTTSFTAQQVAAGMAELGRAGFSPQEIDDSIAAMLNLARATGVDIAEASNTAGAALRAFDLDASQATRVADVLAATANGSAQTITDLGEALKYTAPVAETYGMTLEETNKALGALANFGIKGSMAGNTLKRVMLQLANTDVQKTLKALGVGVVDANGNMRNISDVLIDIGKAAAHMGQGQRLSLFDQLFGDRAIAGAAKLTAASFERLNEAIDQAAGTAARTAAEMDSGIGGVLRRLWSAIEGGAIAIGDALAGPLGKVGDKIAEVVTRITELITANKKLVIGAVKVIAIVAAVGAVLLAAGTAAAVLAFAIGGLVAVASGAATVVGFLGSVIGAMLSPIGLVAAAIVALGAYIVYATGIGGQAINWLGKVFRWLGDIAGESIQGIGDALAANDLQLAAKILWLGLKLAWEKGIHSLTVLWLDMKHSILDTWITVKAALTKTWQTTWFVLKEIAIKNGLAEPLLDQFHLIEFGWLKTVQGMGTAWLETVALIFKGWNQLQQGMVIAQQAMGEIAIDVMGYFDEGLDTEAAKKMLREDYAEEQTALEADRAALQDQLDADRKALAARHRAEGSALVDKQTDRLLELKRQEAIGNQGRLAEMEASRHETDKTAAAERAALDQRTANSLNSAADALDAAKKEWREAIAEAAKKRADRQANAPEAPDSSRIDDLIAKLRAVGPVVAGAVGRIEVQGTFDLAGLRALMSAGASDSVAANTAEMVRQQKQTNRKLDEAGGLAFL